MLTNRVRLEDVPAVASLQSEETATRTTVRSRPRPEVRGKFIFCGKDKLYIRGVTYGTFRPDAAGDEFPALELVESDFTQMAAAGVNAVRTYTVPPRWLLVAAARHRLWIMVGLPIERSAGVLDYRQSVRS